jgi:hypothetical protein
VRRILAGVLLVGGAIAFLVLLAGPAAASNCDPTINPGCQNAATTAGVQAAVTGAIVAVAVGVGVSLGGPTTSTTTEQVVVSGQEAVDILVQQGGQTVVRDGKTYLVPPSELTGGYTTTTLSDGTKVVAPEDLAIVQNVPVPTGATTTVQGGAAVNALVNEGFSTHTDGSGNVYVKTPPNLIHGNVTGVAYGGTTTVDGIEVIDPNSGVVVVQTGPSAAPPPAAPPPPAGATTAPAPAPSAAGAAATGATPPAETKAVAPVEPTETKGATEVPQPPRTPTDAKSLTSSLTQPGTTVITPGNVPAFAPEVLAPDGTIKVTNPKLPEAIRNLNGQKMPTPTISEGKIGVDLPGRLGHVDVTLRAEGGRLVSQTETSGPLKGIEAVSTGANLIDPNVPEIDAGRAVQNRIDRYNRSIQDAGLEVKSVSAEGGKVQVVTGRK